MYFNEKRDVNLDKELSKSRKHNAIKKNRFNFKINTKFFIIPCIIVVLVIVGYIIVSYTRKDYFLELIGNDEIVVYQNSPFVDPGVKAYDLNNNSYKELVTVDGFVDTSVVGEYKLVYSFKGKKISRNINVIEKNNHLTYIVLNGESIVYLKQYSVYKEPGYAVFDSVDASLKDKVKISGSVNTSVPGVYKLFYSVINSDNLMVAEERVVIVVGDEFGINYSPSEKTNGNVNISIGVVDDDYKYTVLPDGNISYQRNISYTVSENGTYRFVVYGKDDVYTEKEIVIDNIDRTIPVANCVVNQNELGSYITVNAIDDSGIKSYVYNNNVTAAGNLIQLNNIIDNANVIVYDLAGNYLNMNCTVSSMPKITNISQNGVLVNASASGNITGYYFSYENGMPSEEKGFVSTTNGSIEVVRLPGTTYVWARDADGQFSAPKEVTISNDALLITSGSKYKKLENIRLDSYLNNNGWSIQELDKLIARSSRAAGIYSKDAAATSAVSLLTVLAQKYKIKLPYWNGGKSWSFGADGSWGMYKYKKVKKVDYYYYGLDCSGFTTWAYVNAGANVKKEGYPAYFWGWQSKGLPFKESNGEIGDFIVSSGHVKIIVGKTDTAFIAAEANSSYEGMIVSLHKYNSPAGYKIQKGELLLNKYGIINNSKIPSGY
ncbi:MAG: DUF5011 domain-containing protein [Bacilli bacterium]|nr:DUF5011 domain-containing protein [Bacilli bacterium]